MKYLVTILLALCAFAGYGQTWTKVFNPLQYLNLRADTFNLAPGDTILGRNRTAGQLRFKNSDKKLYVWNGTKWESAGTGSGGSGSTYSNGYGLQLSSTTFKVDTGAITTRGKVDQLLLGKQNALTSLNGLTLVGPTLKLGGAITETTTFSGRTNTLNFGTNSFRLNTIGAYSRNGIVLEDTGVTGSKPRLFLGGAFAQLSGSQSSIMGDVSVTINAPNFYLPDLASSTPYMLTVGAGGLISKQVIPSGGAGGTETDPIFSGSAAYPLTTAQILKHDSAYYWGNHALAGYMTQSTGDARWSLLGHTHTFASLTSKPTTISGFGITDATLAATTARGATTTDPVTLGGVTSNFTGTGASNAHSFQGRSGNSRLAKFGDETNSEKFYVSPALTASGQTFLVTGDLLIQAGELRPYLGGNLTSGYNHTNNGANYTIRNAGSGLDVMKFLGDNVYLSRKAPTTGTRYVTVGAGGVLDTTSVGGSGSTVTITGIKDSGRITTAYPDGLHTTPGYRYDSVTRILMLPPGGEIEANSAAHNFIREYVWPSMADSSDWVITSGWLKQYQKLAGSGGCSSLIDLYTDATLAGAGTSADPLRVVGGGGSGSTHTEITVSANTTVSIPVKSSIYQIIVEPTGGILASFKVGTTSGGTQIIPTQSVSTLTPFNVGYWAKSGATLYIQGITSTTTITIITL